MLHETCSGCQLYSWLHIVNRKARLNLERKKIKWPADAKFTITYISNRNLQKLQLALFGKTKIWVYIYNRKHIHWLKLIKGRSKWPNSIRKFITSLIISSFKEIGFFDE